MSEFATSLMSSRLNQASVASELDYNRENASFCSMDVSLDDIQLPTQLGNYHRGVDKTEHLSKHFDRLAPKKMIGMMQNMHMEDKGFQQRVLQRMIELTNEQNEIKRLEELEAARLSEE